MSGQIEMMHDHVFILMHVLGIHEDRDWYHNRVLNAHVIPCATTVEAIEEGLIYYLDPFILLRPQQLGSVVRCFVGGDLGQFCVMPTNGSEHMFLRSFSHSHKTST